MAGLIGSKRVERVMCKCGHTVIMILAGRPGPASARKVAHTEARNCWACQSTHGE